MDDPAALKNLYTSFVKYGMDGKDLHKKCITYRMVEKVLNDQRNNNPENLSYKQVSVILEIVRKRMKVGGLSHEHRVV